MGVFDFFSIGGGKKTPEAKPPSRPERAAEGAKPSPRSQTSAPAARAGKPPKPVPAPAPQEKPPAAPVMPAPPAAVVEARAETTVQAKPRYPEAATATAVIGGEDEVDQALDAAFGEGASRSVTAVSQIATELDEAAVRELYGSIAANHARPIKNLIFELRRGTATKEWLEVCRPVMATLIQGAESMNLPEAARAMIDFDEALVLAQEGDTQVLSGAARDLILRGFEEMAQTLPEAFEVGDDERRRESVIIHALLKQVPDVGHVTFERLYGAGLTTLEALFLAGKEDLSVTTGIPLWLCERICGRIQEHRRDLDRLRRDSGDGERRLRLGELVAKLKACHEGFEKASAEEWMNPALAGEKKEHRQGRQMCALQIDVVLAEMGELDLVEQIQKLPYDRRIEMLEGFLVNSAAALSPEVMAGSRGGSQGAGNDGGEVNHG